MRSARCIWTRLGLTTCLGGPHVHTHTHTHTTVRRQKCPVFLWWLSVLRPREAGVGSNSTNGPPQLVPAHLRGYPPVSAAQQHLRHSPTHSPASKGRRASLHHHGTPQRVLRFCAPAPGPGGCWLAHVLLALWPSPHSGPGETLRRPVWGFPSPPQSLDAAGQQETRSGLLTTSRSRPQGPPGHRAGG